MIDQRMRAIGPETILPVQFFGDAGSASTPEKRLIFAVLLDAIAALRRGDASAAAEAARWIEDDSVGAPLSFSDVCDALGLDAPGLGRGLQTWCGRLGTQGSHARSFPRVQQRVARAGRLKRSRRTVA